MACEIVLSTGETIRVNDDPEKVMADLNAAQVFVPFTDDLDLAHWVKAEHVIAVRATDPSAVTFAPHE